MISDHRREGTRCEDIARISEALQCAAKLFSRFIPDRPHSHTKSNGDPVTAADRAADEYLRKLLVHGDEGWLSEETDDDLTRLSARRVWVVDPLDGTREFLEGIPEWCISVGLVEDGSAVAGGICNPATGEIFVGSVETGLQLSVGARETRTVPLVLASRSEVTRGEWDSFQRAPFTIQPMGSVAYKMARVAAGLADATWSFVPKHEWDVAAGTALVHAAGGSVKTLEGENPVFNCRNPLLRGLIAVTAGQTELLQYAERFGKQFVGEQGVPAGAKKSAFGG